MKQLLTAALLFTFVTIGHASVDPVTVDPVKGAAASATQAVKLDELPAGVQKTLQGAGFTGWKPQQAFVVQQEKERVYIVHFTRGDEQESLKLNEQGGKIE